MAASSSPRSPTKTVVMPNTIAIISPFDKTWLQHDERVTSSGDVEFCGCVTDIAAG